MVLNELELHIWIHTELCKVLSGTDVLNARNNQLNEKNHMILIETRAYRMKMPEAFSYKKGDSGPWMPDLSE